MRKSYLVFLLLLFLLQTQVQETQSFNEEENGLVSIAVEK